jgi:hypothetical protein
MKGDVSGRSRELSATLQSFSAQVHGKQSEGRPTLYHCLPGVFQWRGQDLGVAMGTAAPIMGSQIRCTNVSTGRLCRVLPPISPLRLWCAMAGSRLPVDQSRVITKLTNGVQQVLHLSIRFLRRLWNCVSGGLQIRGSTRRAAD